MKNKRIDISKLSLKFWCNNMYVNVNTKKVYMFTGGVVSLVRNIYTLKTIQDHLSKNFKAYGLAKMQVPTLISL